MNNAFRAVLVSLLLIVLAASILGVGTLAIFSDTETSSGNTFKAGTLDFRYRVSQDGGLTWGPWKNGDEAHFQFADLKPGGLGTAIYQIENIGTIDGLLNLAEVTTIDYENGCNKLEKKVDKSCGNPGPGQGELGARILVTVKTPIFGVVFTGVLKDFSGDYNIQEPLGVDETTEIIIDWLLSCKKKAKHKTEEHEDSDEDDEEEDDEDGKHGGCSALVIQGDSTSLTFNFEVKQE